MNGEITTARQERVEPAMALRNPGHPQAPGRPHLALSGSQPPPSPFPHRAGVVALEPGGAPVALTEATGRAAASSPPDGGVHFRMAVPAWLRGTDLGLTTGALAVLAETALTAAAARRADGDVLAASMHLETRGEWPHPPVPIPVAAVALGGPASPTAPRVPPSRGAAPPAVAAVAARPPIVRGVDGPAKAGPAKADPAEGDEGPVLYALAWTPPESEMVADDRPRAPRAVVSRAAGTITAADGRVMAVMTAMCSIVPAATTPGGQPGAGAQPAARSAAGTPPTAALPASTLPPSATLSTAAAHQPLLAMLTATVHVDGDRAWVRFRSEAWLANLFGVVHGGAGCAIADAAVSAALGAVLPAGSATQVMSMDVTFIRSLPLDGEVEAAVVVRHVGRRLAVVDAEIGALGARPSVLARFCVSRTTLR